MSGRKREQRQRVISLAAMLLLVVGAVVGAASAAQNTVEPSNAGVATGALPTPTASPTPG